MSSKKEQAIANQFYVSKESKKREEERVTCKNCNSYTLRRHVGRMRIHLGKCPGVEPSVRAKLPTGSIPMIGSVSSTSRILKLKTSELDELKYHLLMFIYTSSTSFRAVENKHLVELFKRIGLPNFLPSRREVSTKLLKQCYNRVKERNQQLINGKWY